MTAIILSWVYCFFAGYVIAEFPRQFPKMTTAKTFATAVLWPVLLLIVIVEVILKRTVGESK